MSEKKTPLQVANILEKDDVAETIGNLWGQGVMDRSTWMANVQEVRNYIFATDTNTTSNGTNPWMNKTTIPKLAQIRDNLHANYESALFPNDDWLQWEGGNAESSTKEKQRAITAYMKNKLATGGFYGVISELLLDWIDTGNTFAEAVWVAESTEDAQTGEQIPGFIGPKVVRNSYMDIVFDQRAKSFEKAWKVSRSLKTFGELAEELDSNPDMGYNTLILQKASELRQGGFGLDIGDYNLINGFNMDGFAGFKQYLDSGYVEVLEFEGSIWDHKTQTLLKNQVITVVDRCWVVRQEPMPSWLGVSSKVHAAWRKRSDNLYGMGPLDNLVGMQYRTDHLENSKADAFDLAIHPPLAIQGSVEEFEYGPGVEIYVNEGGSVTELGKNLSAIISADNQIDALGLKMEEMAGAPKQAMGIRTPGEKTKFEVQTLDQAASRIFQQKLRHFEMFILEPLLNRMLEMSVRNMKGSDVVRVLDDDFGVASFMTITKEDITASGRLRPIGARHFAAQAALIQNLQGFFQGIGMDQGVRPHWSGKKVAMLVEELLGLEKWQLFGDNIQVMESTETQQFREEGMQAIAEASATPTEPAPLEAGNADGMVQGPEA